MNESLWNLIGDIGATANGQIRIIGSLIMCYVIYKFYDGPVRDIHEFDYLTVIGGFVLIILSAFLDVWRHIKTPPPRKKLDAKRTRKSD